MSVTIVTNKDGKLESILLNVNDFASIKMHDPILIIDVLAPTREEEQMLEKHFRVEIATREEMEVCEVTSPFHRSESACYMTITAVHHIDGSRYLHTTALSFILINKTLIILRYVPLPRVESFINRCMKSQELCSSHEAIIGGMIESLVDSMAATLESVGNELDSLLRLLFEDTPVTEAKAAPKDYYKRIISEIGLIGNFISKNRESLVSINRMIIYYSQLEDIYGTKGAKREQKFRLRHITREIYSLGEYSNFLSQRNSFLLDATLGMISVEQNVIIKVFTVASAVFMPPTLIASIYGMNFDFMPELEWFFGYPFALLLIIVSALIPYHFFKRKGWL